ncbi:MAG: glucose 1-dehydrogenase [Clostridiales bacterium]|jgi:NAD(P)-dependent dehydrogenase (short-subunit alcohol dehydrogenase family)|nr:glucose 1-dehydrogenase [Clostridiales bacterium]
MVKENLEKLFGLQNKKILLTGAAGGIGEVLAEGLAGAGGEMLLCDIAEERLAAVAAKIAAGGGTASGFYMDVSRTASIREAVEKIIADAGRVDVLINCAGINKREGFLDVTEETYDRIMDINLKGMYFLSQEVAKHMIAQKSGNIINVASHNSVGMLGGCSVYGASKSAVTALTRSMAVEWAQYGIRANAIAPGHFITPLTTVTWEHPERSAYLRERIAMRRPGTPEELVGVTVMLASDSSSYMSGMMIHIDGGCLAGGFPWPYDTKY